MAAAPSKKVAELKEPPEFIADRMKIWDRLKNERDAWVADQPREVITITLPDGKEVPGTSWSTTPYEVASGISKGLADNCIVCKVDGEEWDLDRPFEKSCKLKLIKVRRTVIISIVQLEDKEALITEPISLKFDLNSFLV